MGSSVWTVFLEGKDGIGLAGVLEKSEVSFWELTRVALLESCPSLLEYTRGSAPPLPRRLLRGRGHEVRV